MQLFSIGLWRLHMNGTIITDAKGKPLATYDNDDIATFARVWTGLDRQPRRSNTEWSWDQNNRDPMKLKVNWRDRFPKTKLDSGYLGDGSQCLTPSPETGVAIRIQSTRTSFV